MKKVITASFLFAALTLVLSSFAPADDIKIPKKLNAVIQNKCYGCHSPQGRSDKAKEELMWDELNNLPAHEQVVKLKHIQEVLKDGSMPPARFVEGNPDKKLTEKDIKAMNKWAAKHIKKLSK